MATYFVTGGTGFLGAYVIRDLLAANHHVTAFDLFPDLPMLELVGTPVAMNPDRRLLWIARRHGWQVLDFRVARRRTLVASAAGGGAAVVGALAYALGYALGRSRAARARA